jgi:hypothetical protein
LSGRNSTYQPVQICGAGSLAEIDAELAQVTARITAMIEGLAA